MKICIRLQLKLTISYSLILKSNYYEKLIVTSPSHDMHMPWSWRQ